MWMFRGLAVIALGGGLVGCAAPAAGPGPSLGLDATLPERQVQGTAVQANGGRVEIRPDAPWSALGAPVSAGALGQALVVECFPRDLGKQALPAADKVYYADGTAFELKITRGATLAVTDGDASDGKAAVTVPAGQYALMLGTIGKPGGSLEVTDPIYFQRGTVPSDTGKPTWTPLGGRALPLDAAYRRGDYTLQLTGNSLTSFRVILAAAAGPAPMPPVPPFITSFSGPDELVVNQSGRFVGVASDMNGDAVTYRWAAVEPGGACRFAGFTSEPFQNWSAPKAGLYELGLSVFDDYFVTRPESRLPVKVVAATQKHHVNGGGWVMLGGAKKNMQVQAKLMTDGKATGTVHADDPAAKTGRFVGKVAAMTVEGTRAVLTGTLSDNKTRFQAEVRDLGEGKKAQAPDHFRFAIDRNGDGAFTGSEWLYDHALGGGNLQVR